MPQPFNVVSQDETEETTGLGSHNGIQVPTTTRSYNWCPCRYMYIPPKIQLFIAASVALLSLTLIIVHLSVTSGGGGKGEWPPPGVSLTLYADDIYDSKKKTKLQFQLEPNKSYKQFTKMTTSSEYDFGTTDFVESLHMMIDSTFDVSDWYYEGEHVGYSIGVVFSQVAVETEDSSGDSTYYNSLAQNGDSDFDEVLQSMVGEIVTVDVDEDYDIVDEEDNENTLDELEQEYSYGTTTGLSAVDQIEQITNLISFLPTDQSKSYGPNDSWEIAYTSDVEFQGKSTFEGYVKYNGYECAVITTWAYLDEDGDNTLGDDEWGEVEEVTIENGRVDSTMFWDIENNIPRFASLKIQMTTEIEEDEDEYENEYENGGGSDNDEETNTVELPMTETIELYLAPAW